MRSFLEKWFSHKPRGKPQHFDHFWKNGSATHHEGNRNISIIFVKVVQPRTTRETAGFRSFLEKWFSHTPRVKPQDCDHFWKNGSATHHEGNRRIWIIFGKMVQPHTTRETTGFRSFLKKWFSHPPRGKPQDFDHFWNNGSDRSRMRAHLT